MFEKVIEILVMKDSKKEKGAEMGRWKMWKQQRGKRIRHFVLLLLAGMVTGILLVGWKKQSFLGTGGFLAAETMSKMRDLIADERTLSSGKEFRRFVLFQRLKQVLLPMVLSTTYLGLAVSYLFAWDLGLAFGMFLASAVVRYGAKGILLQLTILFPHSFFYLPAFLGTFLWCENTCREIYFSSEKDLFKNREKQVKKGLQLAGILALLLAGCFAESYLNPPLLEKLLRNF